MNLDGNYGLRANATACMIPCTAELLLLLLIESDAAAQAPLADAACCTAATNCLADTPF
jgi:hypothetical protein